MTNDPSLYEAVAELQAWRAQMRQNGLSALETTSAQIPMNTVSVTNTYSVTGRDKVILADATSGAFTVTLPNAVNRKNAQPITVKRLNSGAHAVTVGSAGGTIDGATTVSLASQYSTKQFVSNGTVWHVIASF